MDSQTWGNYIGIPYTNPPTFSWVNLVETLIESRMLTHKDIPTFKFRPLEEVREMLQEAGYSQEDIDGTVSGLSELPEYANSHSNTTSNR